MPSAALTHWQNDRLLRLNEVEAHCADWKASCDAWATLLDAVMRAELTRILGVAPW